MTDRQQRFTSLLKTLFELDKSDLNFGIYRIMNIRRDKIIDFLENGLPKKIEEVLKPFAAGNVEGIKAQILNMETDAKLFGCQDILSLPDDNERKQKYESLMKQLKAGADLAALEADVYSALFNFFNRYYDEGDFISKRRYKEGVYAIPYEGEEVKLYWANQDQYYIKTSENFKDYTFIEDGITVHFRLVDATTEQNNNKESDNSKRAFMLYTEQPDAPDIKTFEWDETTKELTIRFIFDIPEDKKVNWLDVNHKAIVSYLFYERKDILSALTRNVSADSQKPLTVIERHLKGYVAKNTFDYFIHKDLRGFLTLELDFFIKNEVMHLDDIDTENEVLANTYLAKVRAVKRVGKVIIDFLAQIEDFQKKLWLKKKFVVETNWCITLDRIDESFWPEIIANKEQVREWVEMYAINEICANLTTVGYSEPLTMEFLRQNQNLIVDTKWFDERFKYSVLNSLEDIGLHTTGLMINGDNSQALRLISSTYEHQIQTTYIDPPYNTVFSEILYKNNYKHSSWLSLLNNTMPLLPKFWTNDFSFGLAIDDYEFVNLAKLIDNNFPTYERSVAVINHHPQGAGGRLSRTHEYYILVSSAKSPSYLGEPVDDYQEDRAFMRSGTAENNYRYGRWKSFYALLYDPTTNTIVNVEDPVPLDHPYPTCPTPEGYLRIYPINSSGEERVWRSSYLTGRERAKNNELFMTDSGTVYQSIDHESERKVLFSNWTETKFNAGVYGANLLRDMGLGSAFDYPKSINTMETALWAQTYGRDNGFILDYFGGSGTTAHATINLNRKYGGSRKFITVEMGDYFSTATLPRIKKAAYASEWSDGKPIGRNSGLSQIIKYIRLESYEDALSNIHLEDPGNSHLGLFGEEYLINYMLDIESKGSLLNLKAFKSPFDYKMKITEKNECKERKVDICETFNYLIGLTVYTQSAISYFSVTSAENPLYEGAMDLRRDSNGQYGFRQIEGTLPDGRRALIIWRTISDNILESNAALDAYFLKYRINPQDREYDVIYVNGDSNLENLKVDEDHWKVVLTEKEFNERMFEEA